MTIRAGAHCEDRSNNSRRLLALMTTSSVVSDGDSVIMNAISNISQVSYHLFTDGFHFTGSTAG